MHIHRWRETKKENNCYVWKFKWCSVCGKFKSSCIAKINDTVMEAYMRWVIKRKHEIQNFTLK